MISTGILFPIRVFDGAVGSPELSLNRTECRGYDQCEFFRAPTDRVLPFQISPQISLKGSKLVNLHTEEVLSVSINQEFNNIEDRSWSSNMGTASADIPPGLYNYVRPISGGAPYYSDPFLVVRDLSGLIHLKYRGTVAPTIQGDFYWREGLYAECYIDADIQKPTYPIMEETEQDQQGDQHRVFQRWEKRHTIEFLGVESMADAMSLLPLMDEVYVNDMRVYDVLADISWDDEYDCLATITISFLTSKVIKSF